MAQDKQDSNELLWYKWQGEIKRILEFKRCEEILPEKNMADVKKKEIEKCSSSHKQI